jgi:hypothetical protein
MDRRPWIVRNPHPAVNATDKLLRRQWHHQPFNRLAGGHRVADIRAIRQACARPASLMSENGEFHRHGGASLQA